MTTLNQMAHSPCPRSSEGVCHKSKWLAIRKGPGRGERKIRWTGGTSRGDKTNREVDCTTWHLWVNDHAGVDKCVGRCHWTRPVNPQFRKLLAAAKWHTNTACNSIFQPRLDYTSHQYYHTELSRLHLVIVSKGPGITCWCAFVNYRTVKTAGWMWCMWTAKQALLKPHVSKHS